MTLRDLRPPSNRSPTLPYTSESGDPVIRLRPGVVVVDFRQWHGRLPERFLFSVTRSKSGTTLQSWPSLSFLTRYPGVLFEGQSVSGALTKLPQETFSSNLRSIRLLTPWSRHRSVVPYVILLRVRNWLLRTLWTFFHLFKVIWDFRVFEVSREEVFSGYPSFRFLIRLLQSRQDSSDHCE